MAAALHQFFGAARHPCFEVSDYYTLHRLSVQIEVPSRGSISKKKLVCLYKFGMIFFRRVFFYNIFKNEIVFCVYFF